MRNPVIGAACALGALAATPTAAQTRCFMRERISGASVEATTPVAPTYSYSPVYHWSGKTAVDRGSVNTDHLWGTTCQ